MAQTVTFTDGTTASAPSSVLDAVNDMLGSCGISPATALDTGGTSEEAIAEDILDRTRCRVLSEGWDVNTRFDVEHAPDGSNHIDISSDLLGWRPSSRNQYMRLAVRGVRLYDEDDEDSRDEFTSSVYLDVFDDVAFNDLGKPLQTYITKLAGIEFQREIKGGQVDDAWLRDEMMRAKAEAYRADTLTQPTQHNLLQTGEARDMRGHRFGFNWRR